MAPLPRKRGRPRRSGEADPDWPILLRIRLAETGRDHRARLLNDAADELASGWRAESKWASRRKRLEGKLRIYSEQLDGAVRQERARQEKRAAGEAALEQARLLMQRVDTMMAPAREAAARIEAELFGPVRRAQEAIYELTKPASDVDERVKAAFRRAGLPEPD